MSQFITQGDIVRDQFDWGEAGWVSRPEFTGSRSMCVMDVTLQPGAGHPFHRHPDQEEIIWVREARRAVARGFQAGAGARRGGLHREGRRPRLLHARRRAAKLHRDPHADRRRGRLRGHRRLRGGALGVAALKRELGYVRAAARGPAGRLRGRPRVAGAHRPRGEPLRDRGGRRRQAARARHGAAAEHVLVLRPGVRGARLPRRGLRRLRRLRPPPGQHRPAHRLSLRLLGAPARGGPRRGGACRSRPPHRTGR